MEVRSDKWIYERADQVQPPPSVSKDESFRRVRAQFIDDRGVAKTTIFEFLGQFGLTFFWILASSAFAPSFPFPALVTFLMYFGIASGWGHAIMIPNLTIVRLCSNVVKPVWWHAFAHVVAQFAGAFVAAVLARWAGLASLADAMPVIGAGQTVWSTFFILAVGAFFSSQLAVAIHNPKQRAFATAFILGGIEMACSVFNGGCLDWARMLAIGSVGTLFFKAANPYWVYFVGPLVGHVLYVLLRWALHLDHAHELKSKPIKSTDA